MKERSVGRNFVFFWYRLCYRKWLRSWFDDEIINIHYHYINLGEQHTRNNKNNVALIGSMPLGVKTKGMGGGEQEWKPCDVDVQRHGTVHIQY